MHDRFKLNIQNSETVSVKLPELQIVGLPGNEFLVITTSFLSL